MIVKNLKGQIESGNSRSRKGKWCSWMPQVWQIILTLNETIYNTRLFYKSLISLFLFLLRLNPYLLVFMKIRLKDLSFIIINFFIYLSVCLSVWWFMSRQCLLECFQHLVFVNVSNKCTVMYEHLLIFTVNFVSPVCIDFYNISLHKII